MNAEELDSTSEQSSLSSFHTGSLEDSVSLSPVTVRNGRSESESALADAPPASPLTLTYHDDSPSIASKPCIQGI